MHTATYAPVRKHQGTELLEYVWKPEGEHQKNCVGQPYKPLKVTNSLQVSPHTQASKHWPHRPQRLFPTRTERNTWMGKSYVNNYRIQKLSQFNLHSGRDGFGAQPKSILEKCVKIWAYFTNMKHATRLIIKEIKNKYIQNNLAYRWTVFERSLNLPPLDKQTDNASPNAHHWSSQYF